MRPFLLALVLAALLGAGCGGGESEAPTTAEAGSSQPATTEVSFRSDDFQLVGDLHLPGGNGPHGGLIMVHGSGDQTRNSIPTSGLIEAKFLEAGYAVLSWDKPGNGASTGEFDAGYGNTQRAQILSDAIAFLAEQPSVDPNRIGLWGLSEAGWVMPMTLTLTDDISFMIVVNGGGEDSIEQMVYQWTQQARCGGASDEEITLMEQHGAKALKATTYAEYSNAMEPLLTIPNLSRYIGVAIELVEEANWAAWPRDIDAFFDPIEVIEQTTVPVLAIFGEQDIQVDPIQGAEAYRAALQRAGNTDSRVEIIPGVGHTLKPSPDGCAIGGGGLPDRYEELIEGWIADLPAG